MDSTLSLAIKSCVSPRSKTHRIVLPEHTAVDLARPYSMKGWILVDRCHHPQAVQLAALHRAGWATISVSVSSPSPLAMHPHRMEDILTHLQKHGFLTKHPVGIWGGPISLSQAAYVEAILEDRVAGYVIQGSAASIMHFDGPSMHAPTLFMLHGGSQRMLQAFPGWLRSRFPNHSQWIYTPASLERHEELAVTLSHWFSHTAIHPSLAPFTRTQRSRTFFLPHKRRRAAFALVALGASFVLPAATASETPLLSTEWILDSGEAFAVSTGFSSGALTLTGDGADDTITVGVNGSGNVTLNGAEILDGSSNPIAASSVTSISVNGGAGADTINLSAVTSTDFTGSPTVTVVGETGSDSIVGSALNDSIAGGDGNDTLDGGSGNDTLSGNAGNDSIVGGAGTNRLSESGDVNFDLDDTLLTGLGTDTLSNILEAVLTGGSSANSLDASGFSNLVSLFGGAGNDTLLGGSNNDSLDGGSGTDSLSGNDGNDTLSGGANDDTLVGGNGTDRILESFSSSDTAALTSSGFFSSLGNDGHTGVEGAHITGSEFNDAIFATNFGGSVSIFGGSGNDTIEGTANADLLQGGPGTDSLTGNNGNDTLLGEAGNDTLLGGEGVDSLLGGSDTDSLLGGNGNDILKDFGNLGNILNGEAGADVITHDVIDVFAAVLSDDHVEDAVGHLVSDTNSLAAAFKMSSKGTSTGPTLTGGAGNDTITTKGLDVTQTVDGSDDTDQLIVDADGAGVTDTGSQVQVTGKQAISYSNIESVSLLNALPVELVLFEAKRSGRTVQLIWQTQSESGNAGFDIQHRAEMDNSLFSPWVTQGFVEGAGTTTAPQSYHFDVPDVLPGRHRFRLKQIDFDGTVAFSPEVEVNIEVPDAYLIGTPYPNPFRQTTAVTVALPHTQQVRIVVYNAVGQLIERVHEGPLTGNRTYPFELDGSAWASGLYVLEVQGEAFRTTRSFVRIP